MELDEGLQRKCCFSQRYQRLGWKVVVLRPGWRARWEGEPPGVYSGESMEKDMSEDGGARDGARLDEVRS